MFGNPIMPIYYSILIASLVARKPRSPRGRPLELCSVEAPGSTYSTMTTAVDK
jgi:hypothetical protein